MEKFSAYRDPGTGIQPFLTPVPPLGSEFLAKITLPLRFLLGVIRTALLLLLLAIYIVLVPGFGTILTPIPPLYCIISHIFTAIIARTSLLLLGFFWIPVEQVTRKRGRTQQQKQLWNPRAGDIIVSNWVSWIELLWLAFRPCLIYFSYAQVSSLSFNPTFVIPISKATTSPPMMLQSTPITHTPGRRMGTGSANIQHPNKTPSTRLPIIGFRRVSLISMLRLTGRVPPFGVSMPTSSLSPGSLESIRSKSNRPIVIFPECTTSNGRGLLRFADVFHQNIPVKQYQVYVMCVRYDPPTTLSPSLARSIPSNALNPLPHVFTLASSFTPPKISIRLLAPSDSPSSPIFIASEVITGSPGEDQLAEACATLIAQIGKMKRMGMGWEDKANFLQFYQSQ